MMFWKACFNFEYVSLICRRVHFSQGPKDTCDGSPQGKSPCEVDSNEGRVGGRIEGRTGAHVESEVVLMCEGSDNKGACDMLCKM